MNAEQSAERIANLVAERDNWQRIAGQQREAMENAIAEMAHWQGMADARANQIAELLERTARRDLARDAHKLVNEVLEAAITERDQRIASQLLRIHGLEIVRDAYAETQRRSWLDATDPGPTLVAETRAAFPAAALRGGNGRPVW